MTTATQDRQATTREAGQVDDQAVAQELSLALIDTHNMHDAEALGALFTDDAEFVNIVGGRQTGRTAITNGHAAAFQGPLAGVVLKLVGVDAKRIAPDVVLAHAVWDRSLAADAGPRTLPPGSGLFTMVIALADGEAPKFVALSNVQHPPTAGK
jgi:uncharacterized protein (TIGR02246 family)